MNVVLDNAEEFYIKSGNRKTIGKAPTDCLLVHVSFFSATVGRILLKGDCITLIQRVDPKSGASL